jgi:phytoene synthase
MVEARRFDLYSDPMPTVNDLEGYCGETAGALIQLASLVLDPASASGQGETAGHAGCAQAIAGLLALMPRHRARRQCYVPAEILAAAGADIEDLFADAPGEAAGGAIEAMIALAREHLSAFERGAAGLPPALRPAYLPLSFTRRWLDALERAGASLFQHSVEVSPFRRNLSMLGRAAIGWR